MSFQSRNRVNFALLAVVATLAALAWWKAGIKLKNADQPLLDFPAAQVSDIRLQLAGKPAAELKRVGKHWYLDTPFLYTADDNLVQGFLDGLTGARAVPVAGAGRDLSQYGLDKPLVRLGLDDHEYAFGGAEPVNSQHYVLANGQVELTDPVVFYQLSHDLYWWLDKHLLPRDAHISALQLPHWTLLPDAHGRWQLSPADDSVSADAIQKLIEAWQQATAIGIAPLTKTKPEGEVALQLLGVAEPLRFQILKDPDFLVLARPDLGLEYQLDQSQAATLLEFAKPAPAPATVSH